MRDSTLLFHRGRWSSLTTPWFAAPQKYPKAFFSTARMIDGTPLLEELHFERLRTTFARVYQRSVNWTRADWEAGLERMRGWSETQACRWIVWDEPGLGTHMWIEARDLPPAFEQRFRGMELVLAPSPTREAPETKWLDRSQLNELAEHHNPDNQYPFEVGILSPEGHLIEGLYSNILLELDGQWVTPRLTAGLGLEGVAKQSLIQHAAKHGIAIEERIVPHEMLLRAKSIWLTNGLMGVVPVVRLQGKRLNSVSPLATHWSKDWALPWQVQ